MTQNAVLLDGWRDAIEIHLREVNKWREGINSNCASTASLSSTSSLEESCRYVSQGGGKRLRGLLACSVAHDLSGEQGRGSPRGVLSSALAVELLHAASLVHDDLPALDNDDMRRGRASCHKAFGEATAILTGDALIGAAFLAVTSDSDIPSDTQARVVRIIARAWWDLCVGQQFDIEQQKGLSTMSRSGMIRLKTGALFGAAVGCGAVCGGIREAIIDDYIEWGTRVGECFQALDDLDDGDRLPEERSAVKQECVDVFTHMSNLNPKLAHGATSDLLTRILDGCIGEEEN